MANKRTFCFRYKDIDNNLCFIWIEAFSLDGAKIRFNQEATDCFKLIDIQETFNW